MPEFAPMSAVTQRLTHWGGSATVLALGVGAALVFRLAGSPRFAILFLVLAVAVGWWYSPARRGAHEPLAAACSGAGHQVVVLWHPGCPMSAGLRRDLRGLGPRVHWVNIWRDDEGAALCRQLNHGIEQVPTAVVIDAPAGAPVTVVPASREGIAEAVRDDGATGGVLRAA